MRTTYHQKNRNGRRSAYNNIFYALLIVVLGIELVFSPIRSFISTVALPIQGVGSGAANVLESVDAIITAKPQLVNENNLLRDEIDRLKLEVQRSSLYRDENNALRTLLQVQNIENRSYTVAQVIAHPPATAYDTLLIKVPASLMPSVDTPVFSGDIYIGNIEEISDATALVRLVTSDTLTQDVYVGETSILLSGTGGGTFEVTVPKGFEISDDQIISHVQFPTQPFARVEFIETDEIQAVQRVYLQALFQLHAIRYVNF